MCIWDSLHFEDLFKWWNQLEKSEHPYNDGSRHQVVLVERYLNGTSKRYLLDDEFHLTTILEDESKSNGYSLKELPWLPDIVKDFVLPAGFPGSVSEDYLEYMLLQFPTNVTAWICHTLVTSSLLKAVGLDYSSGTTAAASAAAIRWVSKDGIGAVGRFFIGGRFGNLFDDDPKQWRMYADFIGSAGSIFDLCTPLYPAYFLPLASLGNLAKAVARGLKDPSFRVIQNHFAVSGNLGDVAAKEEVWEVSAQLIGLGLGILVLSTPGLVRSYPVLASTWMTVRLLHLWLRYQSLSALQFDTVNLKRARILVNLHVSNSTVLGCEECNKMENILSWEKFSVPRIVFGVSFSDMLGGDRSGLKVKKLLELYAKEKYILVVNQEPFKDFETLVSFKDGATSLSVLRSIWQAYWLYNNRSSQDNLFDQLKASLNELDHQFDNFLQQLKDIGWDINQISLKVANDVLIKEVPVY
ncbi:protein root UVB sensitive 5 isoform X2 [Rutidosis leptorrhynchoides]|uniref:protein root UVB sensitive 5 isoform X2 n=1 Tax=Rutidosis leptorrhynchoides TaxID=125765 RepID=UPI003A99718B